MRQGQECALQESHSKIQVHVLIGYVAGTMEEDVENMRRGMQTRAPIHVDNSAQVSHFGKSPWLAWRRMRFLGSWPGPN